MCLYTIQTKTRIAKKDIKVYKLLDEEGRSVCRNFEYVIGVEYEAKIGIKYSQAFLSYDILANRGYLSHIRLLSKRWRNIAQRLIK